MGLGKKLFNRRESSEPSKLEYYEGVEVLLDPEIFGPGIKSKSMPVSFIFSEGGVGDYINWSAAIKYVQETQPHVDGRVFVSELFIDVARFLFQREEFPRWKVELRKDFEKHYEVGSLACFPRKGTQLINACGAHLLDLGFMYYACRTPPPAEYNFLPEIDFEGPWRWPELDPKSDYAVLTPGATTTVRELPPNIFSDIVEHTRSKGITPVFLGKQLMTENYKAGFQQNLSGGIDLRERTSLLETVQIMRGAKYVVGLDNGLLHLAGTTDVPIIFGHNITEPEHRTIRRRKGLTVDVVADKADAPCSGCQSKMRFLNGHNFKECFFKGTRLELVCHTALAKNNSAIWRDAIDLVLKVKT